MSKGGGLVGRLSLHLARLASEIGASLIEYVVVAAVLVAAVLASVRFFGTSIASVLRRLGNTLLGL